MTREIVELMAIAVLILWVIMLKLTIVGLLEYIKELKDEKENNNKIVKKSK